jgi:hypothetical protein
MAFPHEGLTMDQIESKYWDEYRTTNVLPKKPHWVIRVLVLVPLAILFLLIFVR